MKPKYGEKNKAMLHGYSFIVYIKRTIYVNIAKDIEPRFDIPNYESDRALPKWNNKKEIGSMKDELGIKITKTYTYLTDSNNKSKIAKGTKKCAIKQTEI